MSVLFVLKILVLPPLFYEHLMGLTWSNPRF